MKPTYGLGLLVLLAACGSKSEAKEVAAKAVEGGGGGDQAAAGGKGSIEPISGDEDWFEDMWKAEKDRKKPIRPTAAKITVTVKDFQLHHPFSKDRALLSASDDAKTSKDYRYDAFGVGLVLEAKNDTGVVLDRPFLIGHIEFVTAQGKAGCTFSGSPINYRTSHLTSAADPAGKVKWKDETYAGYESSWRPGETVRLMARQGCGNLTLLDHGIESVTVEYVVLGSPALVDEHLLMSDRARLDLPGRAALLQDVKLPDGSRGVVSGDVVVHLNAKGQVAFDGLSTFFVPADKAARSDVAKDTPMVSGQEGALSYRAGGFKLVQWVDQRDGKDVKKGTRALQVSFEVSYQRPAAEDLDDKAATKLRAATVKSLACDKIALVTNAGTVVPLNKGEAAAACKLLVAEDKVSFTLTYKLGRYELPVALAFSAGGVGKLEFIASEPLLALDPR
jgi:hypothetical protein